MKRLLQLIHCKQQCHCVLEIRDKNLSESLTENLIIMEIIRDAIAYKDCIYEVRIGVVKAYTCNRALCEKWDKSVFDERAGLGQEEEKEEAQPEPIIDKDEKVEVIAEFENVEASVCEFYRQCLKDFKPGIGIVSVCNNVEDCE